MASLGLNDFAGVWRLERGIEDFRAVIRGQLAGRAVFQAEGAGLRYRETGTLRYGDGPAMQAARNYLWRAGEGGRIVVQFDDGRAFHDFALGAAGAASEAAHLCGADLYRVRYDFALWPDWQALWRVVGPAKDYCMVSRYTPGP